MMASRIRLPMNENPKVDQLDEEDKNILAAFRIVFDGYRRAQNRTRAVIKAYNELESVASTLLREHRENRDASSPPRENNAMNCGSPKIDVDDELADVLLVDLTSDFDFERGERFVAESPTPRPIFGLPDKTIDTKRSAEVTTEEKKATKLQRAWNQVGTKMDSKMREGNKQDNSLLGNSAVKIAVSGIRNGDSKPSVKLSLTKSAYRIDKSKAACGKTTKQSTLVFQPIAAKVDITSSQKMTPQSKAPRDWADLFGEDYRVKKTTTERESSAAAEKKDLLRAEKKTFDRSVESPLKVSCDSGAAQNKTKPYIVDDSMIMETQSQIDESARSLFEDEDLEDFQISQDILNNCMDTPALTESAKLTDDSCAEKKVYDATSSTLKTSQQHFNCLDSIDETFFAPAEFQPINNVINKPAELDKPVVGCSAILTPKKTVDNDRNFEQNRGEKAVEKDVPEDLNLKESDWDTDMWIENCLPTKRRLNNSFDIVPETKRSLENIYKGKTGRGQRKFHQVTGWSCQECENYYGRMNLPEVDLRRRLEACRRHTSKMPKYCTPKDFWNPEFPETVDSSDYERDND